MAHIQWAQASQFNWAFDNMGGTPLQEAVAGNWSNAAALVQPDGRVLLESPNPGGGQVYFIRGVWLLETTFPWDGFWAAPLSGDLTDYYQGGSFANQGEVTAVTLGTALPVGTPVQLYYIYLTGEQAAKYEPLNNYPCIRRAYRSRDDYTYDFPVDRLLDLMVFLHFAAEEQGLDYSPMIQFLWEAFQPREESRIPPLVHDSMERQFWDQGAYLMYRGATTGVSAFQVFQTELAAGATGKVLHVRVDLPTTQDAAWFGYGLDWALEKSPFREMDRVTFSFKGLAASRRVHNLTKVGSGSATLVILGDYVHQEKQRFLVQVETTGEVGQATFRWSLDGGLTWEAEGLLSGDAQHPVALGDGIEVYWESGAGADLIAGDCWTFWGGEPAAHPRRLLVVLNDAADNDPDPWGPQHTFVHALPDRFSELTAFELPFSQFWRRDNIIDDGDRVRAMWGSWYFPNTPDGSQITISDREETQVFGGETFYTQRQAAWNLSPYATAFGVWVGLDPNRCNSTGHTNFNFLLKPEVSGINSLTIRVKVKDAQGSYFYRDETVQANAWQRVTVNLSEMLLESGSLPLTHPFQAVDIGVPASPPSNGTFFLADLKFDEHLTFSGAERLRLLEFKVEQQGLEEHEWWLDEVGLNLEAEDPYPYAPRLAISLTPYGQNPWRGPTPVHYAQPLAPYLVGALNLTQNYLNLQRDAQDEFEERYGGVKGPILPVHTRNDVENIALCGEENFGRFCWWPRYRDYGRTAGAWLFNESLTDVTGQHNLTWSSGSPAYTAGLCQPGNTALSFDGASKHAYFQPGTDFLLGSGDFTLEVVAKFNSLGTLKAIIGVWDQTGNQRSWLFYKNAANKIAFQWSTNGTNTTSKVSDDAIADNDYHHLAVTRAGSSLNFYLDGEPAGEHDIGTADFYASTALLRLGATLTGYYLNGALDYAAVHKGRAMSATEVANRWQIIQGLENGSAYPEVGSALGQFWAFLRLAQYYFVTNDPAAWEVLEQWLTWVNTYGAADGSGWRFPQRFSEYGFTYGSYDPGVAASIALGCLYIHLRNGHDPAATWARRILDDLRLNRQDPDLGGYKSDYHHAWLHALVLQAFGLAVNGRAGQAYTFASTPEDQAHFEALMSRTFAHSGDVKPNILNADLIPFSYGEAADVWDYAPYYLSMRQMGSLEGVALMLGAALEYGKAQGDWVWFQRLLRFILVDNLLALAPSQIRSLTLAYDQAGVKNLVRLRYADYDRDNAKYAEAREEAAISLWGEQPVDLDFRYGGPVVLENPQMAQLLADRLLKRLAAPWELAQVETWLEGVRIELGDTVAVSSDFHGLSQEEFTVFGKDLDLGRRTVRLNLKRPLNTSWSWAVDTAGTDYDAYAIDQNSPFDPNWPSRAFAG